MNSDKILVDHEELGRFIRDLLVKYDASDHDAAVVANGLVWANLRGSDGHGVSRLPRYLNLLACREIDPKAQPRIVHDRAATFVVDAGHGFGPVAVMHAAALTVERAKQIGICLALIRHTTHTGAIGRYAQWIAENGCAAVLMGAALFGLDRLLDPYLTGGLWERFAALTLLVGTGCAIYGVACFATRAFLLGDIKALVRKRKPSDGIQE